MSTNDVTMVLHRVREGGELGARAAQQLIPLLYDELRNLAARALAGERSDHTLQPTALVHEAYLRLVDSTRTDWRDRSHFCRAAARVFRHVLTDHARARSAAKRLGRAVEIPLDDELLPALNLPIVELLAVNEALDKLERLNARHAAVVEMRFFAGLNVDETAAALDVSPRTVADDWRFARAWLSRELASPAG